MEESKTYYYFNNTSLSISVTKETTEITPYTFLRNGQLWENESIMQFYKYIIDREKGDKTIHIVDIGAQSGLYTLFVKYLKNVKCFSFEPFEATFKLLNDNIILNNIQDKVVTYNVGISNKIGTDILNVCKDHTGLNTLGKNLIRFTEDNCVKTEVKITTLDEEFFKKDIKVDYIKIDTEGYEYFILEGGIETIKKYRPVIQLEWVHNNMLQCNVKEKWLVDFFDNISYRLISISGEERLYAP